MIHRVEGGEGERNDENREEERFANSKESEHEELENE